MSYIVRKEIQKRKERIILISTLKECLQKRISARNKVKIAGSAVTLWKQQQQQKQSQRNHRGKEATR